MSKKIERRPLGIQYGNAICYSGYREGQDPRHGIYPSMDEIREDLQLLAGDWKYLRIYDSSTHAERVLAVIEQEGLDFKVMAGADLAAEVSNPNCPWGAHYSDKQLASNVSYNLLQMEKVATLANRYSDIVFAVSIGNEASVEWTDHLVPNEHLIQHARYIREHIKQPVTFCENYVPWTEKLGPLAEELDFISVHTYPVWEYQPLEKALAYTQANYQSVAECYLDVPVVITEAGWTTGSNGRGIEPDNASEALQAGYYKQLQAWSHEKEILTFVFEAFDEPWKGSDDPMEPEKHWGLYRVDRTPKQVLLNT